MASREKTVLVTGASGVVGSALVDKLDNVSVVCLTHRTCASSAELEEIRGDVTQPQLGLADGTFAELTRRTDAIVHCAAATGFTASPATTNKMNLGGTIRVLDFAAEADATLYQVSSAFVARAEQAHRHQGRGPSTYLESKRAAEEEVLASGLPAVIVRPSVVMGDSHTGEIARFQGLHALAGAVVKNALPLVPLDADARVDFVPQDIVAESIAALVEGDERDGEYWLTSGESAPPVRSLIDWAMKVARNAGREVAPPRLVESDVVDRLIWPVFIDGLPDSARERFDQMLHMAALFDTAEPFASSLGDLQALGVSPLPDLEETFTRSMEFWAEVKGLTPKVEVGA